MAEPLADRPLPGASRPGPDGLPEVIGIRPASRPLDASVRPPGSKSISNRVLLLAALAAGPSRIAGLLDCDDTRAMAGALRLLGVALQIQWREGLAAVEGSGGVLKPREVVRTGNSGTTHRFLMAVLAILGGDCSLLGDEQLMRRPVADLAAALRQLGCDVHETEGASPVILRGPRCPGGSAVVRADTSSQFLSGLLMAAPLARGPVRIATEGSLVSAPYVEMTLRLMEQFGVALVESRDAAGRRSWRAEPAVYQPAAVAVEPDASAASYLFAAAAIAGGTVTVEGLDRHSLQGDLRFVDLLGRMGCSVIWRTGAVTVSGPARQGIECDMQSISDTAQTLAAVAATVRGPTTIRGIAHNRVKETDRIGHLAIELRKAGADVEELPDGLTIHPGPLCSAEFDSWGDHRMAMSLALLGLRQPGIRIRNPGCVTKTFPDFFGVLDRITP